MAALGLLALYAASRAKAGNDIRKKEKQALIPVQFVETANGNIVERDKDDPMHNNLITRYTRVGNQMITATDKAEDIVINPVTKTQMTTEQYRSGVLSDLNKRANPDGLDFGAVNPNQVRMPPVIGQRKRFSGQFTPTSTSKSKNIIEQVGGIIEGKPVFKNSVSDFYKEYNILPTLKQDKDLDTNIITNAGKLELEPKVSTAKTSATYFSTSPIEREFTTKDNVKETYDFSLSSNNKNVAMQAQDINNQLSSHVNYFKKLGKDNPNDPKLVAFTDSIIGLLVRDMEEVTDSEGGTEQVKAFISVDKYLRSKPNLREIPGLAPKLKYARDTITKKQLDQRIKLLNFDPNKEQVSLGVIVKSNNGQTSTMVAEIHKKFTEPTIVNGKAGPSTADTIVNSYGDPNKTADENNGVIEGLSNYNYTRLENGDLNAIEIKDGKKVLKPYNEQYKIRYLENLISSPAAGKNNTQFKVFNAMVQPINATDQKTQITATDEQAIATKYVRQIGSLPNGYQEGFRLIATVAEGGNQAFTSQSYLLKDRLFNQIKEKLPYEMDQKNKQLFLSDANNKVGYSATTIALMKRYKGTYFDPATGKPLDISTAVGNLYLGTDGLLYWFDKARDMAGQLLDNDLDVGSVYKPLAGNKVVETEQLLLSQIGSSSFKRGEIGKSDELYQKRQSEMSDIAAKLKSNNNEERALAQRRYYRMMIAYQMAAAIQGGTGGRTISDQDVDNILTALGSADGLSTPEAEIAGIDAALTLMQEIYQFNKHLAGTPEERYAAMKHQDLMIKGDPTGTIYTPMTYNVDFVTNAIYSAKGTGPTGGKPKIENIKVSDDELLGSINRTAGFEGKSFSTLEEAEKAGIDIAKQRNLIKLRP